jgi:DNA-directed RNA polymerase subunit RPC12/RpoP
MPIETKEIAVEIFKKIKRLTNKKTVTLTLSSSPQLPRQPPLSPPLLPDAMLYFSIWRRIQRRLFPHQHKQAVTDLSTLPNRQMPSPAYIRCSACKSVFYRPSNLSMFRCPHCHCAHFDRHRQEDNEVLFTFTMLLVFVDLILT